MCLTISAESRATLKPVYWFGIPNSDPQTLKRVDFCCKLLSLFIVTEPREQYFELFRMQNSQNFTWLHPWTPLRSAYSTPPPNRHSTDYVRTKLHEESLNRNITFENFEEYSARVKKSLLAVPVEYIINKTIESMDNQLSIVVRKGGKKIKY